MKASKITKITPEAFRQLLLKHNWYYTKDYGWAQGVNEETLIRRHLTEQPELKEIYNEVCPI